METYNDIRPIKWNGPKDWRVWNSNDFKNWTALMNKIKMRGRTIKGFNRVAWEKYAVPLMTVGLCHKFTQNVVARNMLLGTGNALIGEASDNDAIWGIGADDKNPLSWNPHNWPMMGSNYLGVCLMETRMMIQNRV